MKITVLNKTDYTGGASIAAYRIHKACRLDGIDSMMITDICKTDDWTVNGPSNKFGKMIGFSKGHIGDLFTRFHKTHNKILHSPAILPSKLKNVVNNSDCDVVHLHWINGEMLSIKDISKINKPMVWTLHDMWAFSGAEHISRDNRFKDGYLNSNRPESEKGFYLNKWTWKRKKKYWTNPIQIVTPSQWLANCAKKSELMKDWPVTVVPNAIDTNHWNPIKPKIARNILGINNDSKVIVFGALGGTLHWHKGFDLIQNSIKYLKSQVPSLELVVFGQGSPRLPENYGIPIKYLGKIFDSTTLRLVYSAADLVAIPSRVDNLPNIGVESLSCGTPVVAYNTCGLPDIVDHKKNGYLAKPFDTEDFANGINWIINNKNGSYIELSKNAREKAVSTFSYNVVANQYKMIYNNVSGLIQ